MQMAAIDTLTIVLAFVAFWAAVYAIGKVAKLDQKGFSIKPFYLVYKSQRIDGILGRIAKAERLWKVFANISVVLGLIFMVAAFGYLASNLYSFFFAQQSFSEVTVLVPFITIRNTEILTYFFLSLPIILIVHEGGHGVIAKLEKIKVKSGGFAVIAALFAGFVEPDEEEFTKAKPISRLRVVGAGSGANILCAVLVAALLVTTPTFAFVLDALPVLNTTKPLFYGDSLGVPIVDLLPDGGAEKAGIKPNDIITDVKGVKIQTLADFRKFSLAIGENVEVKILRDGQRLDFDLIAGPSPSNASRGALGVNLNQPYYPPRIQLGFEMPREVAAFLFWLFFLSFNIAIFNMLPFYPLDGDGFLNALISAKIPENRRKLVRTSINSLALGLLIANMVGTFIKSGFITI
ncbi:MAG: PDZ domain-containing protein [Thaumarchaeota archaeon]|nr:PDZ domain-containing protein [Nitrososphaerota archaeon]